MSQTKAQLVAPVGVVTATAMTVSGVLTATTYDGNITGAAVSIAQGNNLNVGVLTASGISGDITGSATSITQGNNVTFGSLTASRLVGNLTGNAVGNALGDALSATVTGVTTSNNISVGVVTSTDFRGDGSNLDGLPAGLVSPQYVGFTSAATTIDLSNGNLIYVEQSANTTVSFANSTNGNVYIVRTKDDTSTARTITWPTGIGWSGGSAPTLINNPREADAQVFLLTTRDEGVTWYGKEVMRSDPQTASLWSWGGNTQGSLGQNNRTAYSSPVQVGTTATWAKINNGNNASFTRYHTAGIKTNGTLWLWGGNPYGVLGQNSTTGHSSPVQVGSGADWSSVTLGTSNNSGAVKTDGSLWVWGYNFYGQLGQNIGVPWPGPNHTLGSKSSPVQIPGTWSSTTGGHHHFLAIKPNGTLWSWGYNPYGNLGHNQGSPAKYSSPAQVGTDTTWSRVETGDLTGCVVATKTDGSLWTWGGGSNGGTGQNNITSYSSPMQLGTDTTWDTFSAGYRGVMATKTNGTLWAWGSNTYGALGLNNKTDYSSPMQVGTDTDWSGAGMKTRWNGYAFKTNGRLYAWGRGYYGMQGLNDTANRSSPTQVPGTNWQGSISLTYWGAIALKME